MKEKPNFKCFSQQLMKEIPASDSQLHLIHQPTSFCYSRSSRKIVLAPLKKAREK